MLVQTCITKATVIIKSILIYIVLLESHQYCCAVNILLGECKSKKVGVSNVAVEDKVVEQGVLLPLLLVSHVNVTKLQTRT